MEVHEIVEDRICKDERTQVASFSWRIWGQISNNRSFGRQSVRTTDQKARVEQLDEVFLGVCSALQRCQRLGEPPNRVPLAPRVSESACNFRVVFMQFFGQLP